jgi:hypothetical protein
MQRILSSFVAVAALSTLVACGKGADQPAAAPAAPAASSVAPAAATASTDSIGVPECDAYVTKYMQCVGTKVPEMSRAQYKAAFDQAIAAWKQAAATPQGRAGLAAACTQASTAAAQAMTAFGCTF